MSKPKVFISYSNVNYTDVAKISTMLKEHNINTFVAQYDIKSGEKWSNKIKDGLKITSVFIDNNKRIIILRIRIKRLGWH